MIPVRASERGRVAPAVTVLLIFACVLVFLLEASLPERALNRLVMAYGIVPLRELDALVAVPPMLGEVAGSALTSMFLHGGWAHLLGNMVYLWVFGSVLESRIGHLRFALLYGLAGIAAAAAQIAMTPLSTAPMIGASGAIAGVLGAYLVAFPRARVTVLVPILFIPWFFSLPALVFIGIWIAQQLLNGSAMVLSPLAAQASGVAWWAHIGGVIAGAVLVAFLTPRVRASSLDSPLMSSWQERSRP